MHTNIKILGWLYIVMSAIGLLLGIVGLIVLLGTGLITGEREAVLIMTIIGVVVAGIALVLSVPGILTGIGLLKFKPWARVLAIVLGVLNLGAFPTGTALGVYTLFVLLNEEASALFARAR